MNEKLVKIIKVVSFLLTVALLVFITLYFLEDFISLRHLEKRQELRTTINDLGIKGWLLMLGIQFLQVFIAPLPSEPVELLMGMAFGTFGGLLVGLIGVYLGTFCSYYLAKFVGVPFFKLFIKKNPFEKYEAMQDEKKVALGVFVSYLIVGVPSDIVTYLGPSLKIKPWKFIIISTLARIPKIVTSTFVGHHLVEGNIWLSIGVFIGTGAISLMSVILYRMKLKRDKLKTNEV